MKLTYYTPALAALLCLVLVGAPIIAQAKSKPATGTAGATSISSFSLSLLKQLGLSKNQKKKVKKIEKSTADNSQREKEILAILTPAQKAKLQQLAGGTGATSGKHKHASA